MSGPDFRELVGDDVPAAERERLRRAHDLLVAAGPPPELPPSIAEPPAARGRLAFLPRRRRGALLALAAALAAAAFGAGYFVGDRGGEGSALPRDFVLKMRGTQAAPGAVASLVVFEKDDDGNWPMELTVRNLPPLRVEGRYELYLTRRGKIGPSCGTFLVESDKTIAHLNAPYKLREYDGWVIVRHGSREILVRTNEI